MNLPPRFTSTRLAVPLLFGASLLVANLPGADLSTASQKTIVKSDRLEASNNGVEGRYVFIGNVRITGTNLEITCDRLEIYSVSEPGKDGDAAPASSASSTVPEAGNIRRLLATGNVSIAQEGRRATCGVAEVLPPEDKIILTENPVVTDVGNGVTMKGTRMTAFRGDRSMVIENPEVVGPALPNLGFPTGETNADQPAPAATP